ncbi:MAG: hypothetical protein AAB217_20125, partial [Chloroflexota bacterium]
DRAAITLDSLTIKPSSIGIPGSATSAVAATLPVERLTGHEIEMAEDFLRRHELANRSILARRILQALLDKMGVPASQVSGWQEESLIAEIVRASRSRKTE